jgi:hypothetical protein
MLHSLLIAVSLAQASSAGAAEKPIVITGTPLSATERSLTECLKRHCPPNEDINASIAHAENLFVAGDYEASRSVLYDSISRNKSYARQYPVEVADLYRSSGRVAAHLGEGDRYRQASFSMRRALRSGLPDSDPRVVASLFDLAQMHASLGNVNESFASYELAQRQANRIGRRDIAAAARLRSAWLSHLTGDDRFARREFEAMSRDGDPMVRASRIGALVLLAQLERQSGKSDRTDALIAELRGAKLTKPVLLFAPPVELPRKNPIQSEGDIGSTTRLMPTDTFVDRWIDVGFWVDPNGRVSDLEILRSSGPTDWTQPLMKSIGGRLYAPVADPAGSYRVERYTYTSNWQFVTGTRLRQRGAVPRIEYLDLTAEPGPQASR